MLLSGWSLMALHNISTPPKSIAVFTLSTDFIQFRRRSQALSTVLESDGSRRALLTILRILIDSGSVYADLNDDILKRKTIGSMIDFSSSASTFKRFDLCISPLSIDFLGLPHFFLVAEATGLLFIKTVSASRDFLGLPRFLLAVVAIGQGSPPKLLPSADFLGLPRFFLIIAAPGLPSPPKLLPSADFLGLPRFFLIIVATEPLVTVEKLSSTDFLGLPRFRFVSIIVRFSLSTDFLGLPRFRPLPMIGILSLSDFLGLPRFLKVPGTRLCSEEVGGANRG
mmetsp:Transcript_16306/g.40901  ORF Transcript_16306/g.40901 Transcript_16306/m.40901 type:complete len:282 (-) Transcript_16306:1379-2224(-)